MSGRRYPMVWVDQVAKRAKRTPSNLIRDTAEDGDTKGAADYHEGSPACNNERRR